MAYVVKKYLLLANMTICRVTEKGQVVIPAKLRKKYGIRKGTKVSISESADQGVIILRPLSDDPIYASKGMLKGETSILKAMLRQRKEEAGGILPPLLKGDRGGYGF